MFPGLRIRRSHVRFMLGASKKNEGLQRLSRNPFSVFSGFVPIIIRWSVPEIGAASPPAIFGYQMTGPVI